MTTHREEAAPGSGNGRRAVFLVVGVAFLASATTAMLAFTASHRAREADARALPVDAADLRGIASRWQADIARTEQVSAQELEPYIDRLTGQASSLANWKARTPCGQDARDRLHDAMEAHLRRLTRRHAGQLAGDPPADEKATLEAALSECASRPGQDVNI